MRCEKFEGATLYLADYRDVLGELPEWPIVTDPPYGIGFDYGSHGSAHNDLPGEPYRDLLRPLAGRKLALLQYPVGMMRDVVPVLGPPDECLAWCYPSNLGSGHFRLWGLWGMKPDFGAVKQPCKNPTSSKVKNALVNSYEWWRDDDQWWEQPQVKNVSAEKTEHPCQVPVSGVRRVIRLLGTKQVIDPFLGSGTTAVAAVLEGCEFVGAEVDARWFDIACRQVEAATSQPDMFANLAEPIPPSLAADRQRDQHKDQIPLFGVDVDN